MHDRRAMGLLDAMLWVAATACGLALHRPYSRMEVAALHSPIILESTPVVFVWTIAFVVLRLRPPRPRLRRLFRQPGMAACSTSLVAMVGFYALRYLSLQWGGELGEFEGQSFGWWFPLIFRETTSLNGFCIAVVWFNLAISGRWNLARSWIDGLGLAFATYWIVISGITMFQLL